MMRGLTKNMEKMMNNDSCEAQLTGLANFINFLACAEGYGIKEFPISDIRRLLIQIHHECCNGIDLKDDMLLEKNNA
jgi:hypothetical protein